MRITLIQPVQNQLYDFLHEGTPLAREEALSLQREMTEQTLALMECAPECDLMVTTEAVNYPGRAALLPGALGEFIDEQPLLERFAQLARRKSCYVVAGVYGLRGGKVVNEAVVFDRVGKPCARYEKIHLVGDEQTLLSRGGSYCTVDADFGRFGVCICWDMQFPEVCRHYALQDARLVVCPTWGWESIYAHARAYENGIFVAGAMSVPYRAPIEGIRTPSEVIAPDGTVLACAHADRAEALTCEVDLNAMRELQVLRMHDRQPQTYARLIAP